MHTQERLAEVVSALQASAPWQPRQIVLFGSRARGEERANSDLDLMVELPIDRLDGSQRRQALSTYRRALRPLRLGIGVDLIVVGQEECRQLASSHWHVVGRALREGQPLLATTSRVAHEPEQP